MNSLNYILERQKTFEKMFFESSNLTVSEKIQLTKEFVLCIHQELAELMNTLDWKTYHTYDKTYKIENTKEEIIDCFKFILNIMIVWNIDETELVSLFDKKSDIVENRMMLKTVIK